MMNNSNKSQIGHDYTCKSHSARSDRAELYRICPSKLSKRELEDLYFALLENNLELKNTNNGQQDTIKMLSTKVQRMTAIQKSVQNKEAKECCIATKAIVCEQKDSIADLKTANVHLSERIRLLNMRLCSAKQFLRRSPSGAQATRCNRCSTATAASLKNSSISALLTKRSEGNLKALASCQCLDKDACMSTRSVETGTQVEAKPPSNRPCDENKCKTHMEELEQKIFNLEEELSKTHEEYSTRISRLEREVSDVRKENVVVRSEKIASEHELQQRTRRSSELVTNLRTAEADCNELTMQLSIEKRRVAELEMQLKAANMSNKVARSIENHHTSENDSLNTPTQLLINDTKTDQEEIHAPKSSDDSGYMDATKSHDLVDDKGLDRLNENLIKKISELESKLDGLNSSTAAELAQEKRSRKYLDKDLNGLHIKETDGGVVTAEKKHGDVLKEPEKYDTIASNEEEEPMGFVVINSGNVSSNALPVKSKLPTTPRQDEPSTSKASSTKDNNECNWDKYTGSDEVSPEANYKNRKPNDIIKQSIRKSDQHNKLQIPGPIPSTSSNNNGWNKNLLKRLSVEVKTKNTQKYKTTNDSIQENQTKDNINESGTKDKNNIHELTNTSAKVTNSVTTNDVKTPVTDHSESCYDVKAKDDGPQKNSCSKTSPESIDLAKDSLIISSHHRSCNESGTEARERVPKSMSNALAHSVDAAVACPMVREQGAQAGDQSQLEFCASHSRVCTCPGAKHRAVAMFRTCSGTLRFTTTDTVAAKFRACDCSVERYSDELCTSKASGGPPTPIETPRARRGSTASDRGTYTVPPVSEVATSTRATSTDNTDCEISSMTDLPSEKDAKSPRSPLSPGEDKATITYTDSYTTPMTVDYGSLSEGELPAQSTVRRLSIGETTVTNDGAPVGSSSQKMEAALQAISEELARCKQLLLSQRPQEAGRSQFVALRRAAAAGTIGGARAPTCVFTLHIGTVVLGDEAVLSSRDKTLMLTWQFYDQNIAMTRMPSGRVALFDSSTEYDIKINEDFLDYMKHEEMPILICELGKQDEPFASCALPLRDALAHPNRRVDMSLALEAGPQMRCGAAAAAAPAAGDELGVLDLWCVLRPQPGNRAIATLRSSVKRRDYQNVVEAPRHAPAHSFSQTEPGTPPASASDLGLQFDASKYPTLQRNSSILRRNSLIAAPSDSPSDTIVNEVAASIKSPYDMKQALKRNANQNSVLSITRMHKTDDDLSSLQTRSRVRSFKTILAKLHKQLDRAQKNEISPHRESDILGDQERSSSLIGLHLPPPKRYTEDEDTETYRKYDRIVQTIGSIKPESSKKSVKIYPSYIESEEPQKDTEDERYQQSVSITVLWLALNEQCEAMVDPRVQRLYVAYSFLGRSGAELETPVSLPKPKHYVDKCYFNFKKTFQLHDIDLPLLGHMARCRSASKTLVAEDCIVFTVISEPPEDPLGLANCEDIGFAYLCLGDVLACSGGSSEYTEVMPVRGSRGSRGGACVCGVLAVRVQGLALVRRCLALSHSWRGGSADIRSSL